MYIILTLLIIFPLGCFGQPLTAVASVDSAASGAAEVFPTIMRDSKLQETQIKKSPPVEIQFSYPTNIKNKFSGIVEREKRKPKWARDARTSPYYYPDVCKRKLYAGMNRDPGEITLFRIFIITEIKNANRRIKRLLRKGEVDLPGILKSERHINILGELWKNAPQTCFELYQNEALNASYTYSSLNTILHVLWKEGLVDFTMNADHTIKYFRAMDKNAFEEALHKIIAQRTPAEKELTLRLYDMLRAVLKGP